MINKMTALKKDQMMEMLKIVKMKPSANAYYIPLKEFVIG